MTTSYSVMDLDARYTVALEGTGDSQRQWVARFCGMASYGVYIGAYASKELAEQGARNFDRQRMEK